jgi:glutathione S-transferase
MDWQLSTISEAMRVIFWGLVRTPPDKRDMAAIKKAAVDAGKLWGRLDQKLEGRQYVAGAHLTMGDIPVGCFVHRWYALDVERPELKNVRAWYERLKARPAYAKNVMPPLT